MKHAKLSFALPIAIMALLASCGPNREKSIKAINLNEQKLSAIDITTEDSLAMQTVEMYITFATEFPDDYMAPVYMKRAAEIKTNMDAPEEAIELLDSIISQYPGYDDLADCYFLKGQAYEKAGDYEMARQVYAEFADKYPNHVLAASTKTMLEHNLIGASQEELQNYLFSTISDMNLTEE